MHKKTRRPQASTPLLSICIPTFNRAETLKLLLENIAQVGASQLEKIEIVISDNASTDHTEQVVRSRIDLPIKYNKNTYNIGGAKNLLTATGRLATGDFVWIIGDDDLILPKGIETVLDSIENNKNIDYHYINFGWIKASLRDSVITENKIEILKTLKFNFQCNLKEWKLLSKLEDLATLPGNNPSALFCGIFCFATRRQFFVDALDWIKPTSCTYPTTVHLDDWYPHAMASVIPNIGKPIAYIGTPCMMQAVGGWEWKVWLSKSQIFGVYELFEFIEKNGFDRKCMNQLWRSYYDMAGRIFSLMQCNPAEHKGLDIVLKKSIPRAASNKIFWKAFMHATRTNVETNYEADFMAKHVEKLVKNNSNIKIGIWGLQSRGYTFIKKNPGLHKNIVWIADKSKQLHGEKMEPINMTISPPETIADAGLDCLIIGTQRKHINSIKKEVKNKISPSTFIISLEGMEENKAYQMIPNK